MKYRDCAGCTDSRGTPCTGPVLLRILFLNQRLLPSLGFEPGIHTIRAAEKLHIRPNLGSHPLNKCVSAILKKLKDPAQIISKKVSFVTYFYFTRLAFSFISPELGKIEIETI